MFRGFSTRSTFQTKRFFRTICFGAASFSVISAAYLTRHAQCESKTNLVETKQKKHRNQASHDMGKSLVFAGTGHSELAQEVARELGVDLGKIKCGKFADGETQIQILQSVRGRNIYIIQPTCDPINHNLIELMLLISTFKRASAAKVTAVIPYFGYARQDRIREERETIAAADVARILETAGVDRVITLDLHRGQTEGFFSSSTQLTNLDPLAVGTKQFLKKDLDDPVIVCPSITGISRAKRFRDILIREGIYSSLAFVTPSDESGVMDSDIGHHHKIAERAAYMLVGNVKHSDVVIVDDMIDTGSRMSNAAQLLHDMGAKRIFAYATHGLFSGDCLDILDRSHIFEVVVTDSIPLSQEKAMKSEKVTQIPVAPLIAEAIRRTQVNQSLTILTHPK